MIIVSQKDSNYAHSFFSHLVHLGRYQWETPFFKIKLYDICNNHFKPMTSRLFTLFLSRLTCFSEPTISLVSLFILKDKQFAQYIV